jgi:hypothetical protein
MPTYGTLFAGEEFIDLADAQRKAELRCMEVADQRVHRTTGRRSAEAVAAEEARLPLPGRSCPMAFPSILRWRPAARASQA